MRIWNLAFGLDFAVRFALGIYLPYPRAETPPRAANPSRNAAMQSPTRLSIQTAGLAGDWTGQAVFASGPAANTAGSMIGQQSTAAAFSSVSAHALGPGLSMIPVPLSPVGAGSLIAVPGTAEVFNVTLPNNLAMTNNLATAQNSNNQQLGTTTALGSDGNLYALFSWTPNTGAMLSPTRSHAVSVVQQHPPSLPIPGRPPQQSISSAAAFLNFSSDTFQDEDESPCIDSSLVFGHSVDPRSVFHQQQQQHHVQPHVRLDHSPLHIPTSLPPHQPITTLHSPISPAKTTGFSYEDLFASLIATHGSANPPPSNLSANANVNPVATAANSTWPLVSSPPLLASLNNLASLQSLEASHGINMGTAVFPARTPSMSTVSLRSFNTTLSGPLESPDMNLKAVEMNSPMLFREPEMGPAKEELAGQGAAVPPEPEPPQVKMDVFIKPDPDSVVAERTAAVEARLNTTQNGLPTPDPEMDQHMGSDPLASSPSASEDDETSNPDERTMATPLMEDRELETPLTPSTPKSGKARSKRGKPLSKKSKSRSPREKRDYPCLVCRKIFKTSGHLSRHRYTHLQDTEKPHKCPVEGCTRAFARSDNMKVHAKSHMERMEKKAGKVKVGGPKKVTNKAEGQQ